MWSNKIKISEAIRQLEEIKKFHGDIEILTEEDCGNKMFSYPRLKEFYVEYSVQVSEYVQTKEGYELVDTEEVLDTCVII